MIHGHRPTSAAFSKVADGLTARVAFSKLAEFTELKPKAVKAVVVRKKPAVVARKGVTASPRNCASSRPNRPGRPCECCQ